MGCVSQADSADREGLSKWAIFMLLITKETLKHPPFCSVWERTCVCSCVLTAPASTCRQ